MIEQWRHKTIWAYEKPIDFRKQVNGLIQTVIDESEAGLDREAIYLFRNQGRNRLKLLLWDRNGFFMGYKRLEKGKFDFPTDEPSVQFTWEEFEQLLSGMPIVLLKSQKKSLVYS